MEAPISPTLARCRRRYIFLVISKPMNHESTTMITPRHLAGAALIIAWAILLGTRCVAAAIYSTAPAESYKMGLAHIGWTLPVCAWLSLGFGLLFLLRLRQPVPSTASSASSSPAVAPSSP
jgi:hypothetical protein